VIRMRKEVLRRYPLTPLLFWRTCALGKLANHVLRPRGAASTGASEGEYGILVFSAIMRAGIVAAVDRRRTALIHATSNTQGLWCAG
jgi:hypothetical protein